MGSSTLFQIEFCQNINAPISLTSVENWENYLLKYLNIHTSLFNFVCMPLFSAGGPECQVWQIYNCVERCEYTALPLCCALPCFIQNHGALSQIFINTHQLLSVCIHPGEAP